ncbi:MAG TPA: GTPase RsgA, partial [Polyangiaceae bacterium]|nr:GTPase RsgA [Polyangiaceae bacterium]
MNELARIAIDDGVAYVAWPEGGGAARSVRLDGKMLRDVRARGAPRPVVGDRVEVSTDGQIVSLQPRRTKLARKAAGSHDVEQVIAANVDVGFVAVGADGELNERRLERYLAVVHDGAVEPVVLLMKADACTDLESQRARVRAVANDVDVVTVSGVTGEGVAEVAKRIPPGALAALLGSSGVGKSTLVNRLVGAARQKVGELRDDGKGR